MGYSRTYCCKPLTARRVVFGRVPPRQDETGGHACCIVLFLVHRTICGRRPRVVFLLLIRYACCFPVPMLLAVLFVACIATHVFVIITFPSADRLEFPNNRW